jgi:hypothetical protein
LQVVYLLPGVRLPYETTLILKQPVKKNEPQSLKGKQHKISPNCFVYLVKTFVPFVVKTKEMSKLKLTGKQIRAIGYEEGPVVSVAMHTMCTHYKHHTKEEALQVLKNVLAKPENYL